METPAPKCPACGSEKQVLYATLNAEDEVRVYIMGNRRETWKDRVVERSRIEARVCADCGHISFFATDLAAIRAAAAKIGN